MPETTDHYYTIAAESPAGMIATRSGVLSLDARATRAGVRDHLLQKLIKQHGPGFRVIHFVIKPDLR